MKGLLFFLLAFALAGLAGAQTNSERSLVLVVGAPGEPQYSESFSNCARLWQEAAGKGGLKLTVIGQDTDNSGEDRQRLLETLTHESAQPGGELWLVFIGHGTFDGLSAKFNLRGPDISAADLAAALKPFHRPLVIIQCASASGPFLKALSGPERVVITATRSGYENNATHFGDFLAKSIADPAADLDKDGQTSLLEAFLMASRQTEQFYKDQGRLMTEHPLLDDNGDGFGTPADWFHGTRAVKSAAEGKAVDGVRANEVFLVRGSAEQELAPVARAHRDELEQKLSALRLRKPKMNQEQYYGELENILVELSRLYADEHSQK